jgi:outer membrane receptor protein involved in Fe transport
VTLNAFYIQINKPITYYISPVDFSEGTQNLPRTGTYGLEADYKLRYAGGYLDVNYSFNRAYKNEIDSYAVPGHPELMLGMPAHKLALHGAWSVWKNLRIAPSAVIMSREYAYLPPGDGMGVGTVGSTGTTSIVNLFLTYQDLAIKGLEVGIGARNLLDDPFYYVQPSDNGHAPLQGATREALVRVGYTQPF